MNKEKSLVSVIMPTYNTGKYIREAIESVLRQSYTYFELIIVNDGSTDNTYEIVSSFTDERIRYFGLDKNRGRGYARNFAIRQCRGAYIAISDADDINLPERLRLQVDFLEANQHIAVLGAQLLHFSDQTQPRKIYQFPITPAATAKFFREGKMGVPHAACMMRRECLKKLRYEDAIAYNVEDFELFLQLNQHYRMMSLPQALVLYRNELSVVTLATIKTHELYHGYAIYSANSKMNNQAIECFETWSLQQQKRWRYHSRSLLTYCKVKVKQRLRMTKPAKAAH